jgi:hypothetical protein
LVSGVCLKKSAHRLADARHPGGAADHHHALHLVDRKAGITQRLARRCQRLADEARGHPVEFGLGQRRVHHFAGRQHGGDAHLGVLGQRFLGVARLGQQQPHVARRQRREAALLDHPAEHALVEVVAAQRRVAVGREHFEHALGELEDGNIEGAAAEVVDRVDAFGRVVEAVGDRRRGRLVQQAQHVEAGQLRGILGGLALSVVEVGRHGDHRADEFAAQRGFGALAQGFQDFGRDLDRAFDAGGGFQLHHARRIDEAVRQAGDVVDVGDAASHEALHRGDGIVRIAVLCGLRGIPHLDLATGTVTHHRGQQRMAGFVVQHHGEA